MYVLIVTWSLLMSNGHYNIQQEITTNLGHSQCEVLGKEATAEIRNIARTTETDVETRYLCKPVRQ